MIVCGLDISTVATGYFIFDSCDMKPIDYGFINTSKLSESDKIRVIYDTLKDTLAKYEVKATGIEDIFYSRNAKTMKQLAKVHGAILLLLNQLNIKYEYFSVMTCKSTTMGKIKTKKEDGTKKTGAEMKLEIATKVRQIFNIDPNLKLKDDVTDAASIGYTFVIKNNLQSAF